MITAKVREILLLKANGKQSKEIAYDLDLHIRTVETHIATAKKELEARTVTQAVARAIKYGLISIGEIGMVLILCWSAIEGDIDARRAPRTPTRIVRQFRREVV